VRPKDDVVDVDVDVDVDVVVDLDVNVNVDLDGTTLTSKHLGEHGDNGFEAAHAVIVASRCG